MPITTNTPSNSIFQIICVTDGEYISDKYNMIMESLYDISTEKGYSIQIRQFDSWKYSCDKNEISSLPAFHIYVNGIYRTTTFANDAPLEKIESFIKNYEERKREKLETKKESWMKNIISFISRSNSREILTPENTSSESSSPVDEAIEDWSNPMHNKY